MGVSVVVVAILTHNWSSDNANKRVSAFGVDGVEDRV